MGIAPKLSHVSITHLTTKENLPLRCKSTNEILKNIIIINETYAPFNEETIMAFPDIKNMYPSVDMDEANEIIGDAYENNPSNIVEMSKDY